MPSPSIVFTPKQGIYVVFYIRMEQKYNQIVMIGSVHKLDS